MNVSPQENHRRKVLGGGLKYSADARKSGANSSMSMTLIDQPARRQRDCVNTVHQAAVIFLSSGRGKLKGEPPLITGAVKRGAARINACQGKNQRTEAQIFGRAAARKESRKPARKQANPGCPILIESPQILTVPIYFYDWRRSVFWPQIRGRTRNANSPSTLIVTPPDNSPRPQLFAVSGLRKKSLPSRYIFVSTYLTFSRLYN